MKTEKIFLWQKRIADKDASGLKLDEWCVRNQLTKHAYYYWKRKITDLNLNDSGVPLFVEVPAISAENLTNSSPGAMLIEWNELSIHIADSHSVNLAVELFRRMGLC